MKSISFGDIGVVCMILLSRVCTSREGSQKRRGFCLSATASDFVDRAANNQHEEDCEKDAESSMNDKLIG